MCCVLVRRLTQSLVINKSEEQITHKPELTHYLHSSLDHPALSTAVWESVRAHFCTKNRLTMSSVFTVLSFLLRTEFRVYQERFQRSLFFYLSSSIEKERSSRSLATQAESVRALHNDKSLSATQKPNNKTCSMGEKNYKTNI